MVLGLACLFLFLGAGNQGDLFTSQSLRSLVLFWDCDQSKQDLQRYPGIAYEITMAERGMFSPDSGQKVAEKRKIEEGREESETLREKKNQGPDGISRIQLYQTG